MSRLLKSILWPLCNPNKGFNTNFTITRMAGIRELKTPICESQEVIPGTDIAAVHAPPQYRIALFHLKWMSKKQLTKLLNNNEITFRSVKLIPHNNMAYIGFDDQEIMNKALQFLNGYKHKGEQLVAEQAEQGVKRKRDSDDQEPSKVLRTASQATTPLAHLIYEEQLKHKEGEMKGILRRMCKELVCDILGQKCNIKKKLTAAQIDNPALPEWLKVALKENTEEKQSEPFLCPMESILASPILEGYRNKCEFTIGVNQNRESIVGFRVGGQGLHAYVDYPQDCINIPENAKKVALAIQDIVRETALPPYCTHTQTGFWRTLTVRTSTYFPSDLMAILQINPRAVSPEQLENVQRLIVARLCTDPSISVGTTLDSNKFVSSLYFHPYDGPSVPGPEYPVEHVWGDKQLREELLGLTFHVSPQAFFQVNTLGAELLYTKVKEWAMCDSNTTLIDIYCGTGTIGLCIGKEAKKIVGIELVEPAVEDARKNAEFNGINHAEFICGSAEDQLHRVLQNVASSSSHDSASNFVAVVDPPRAGLHNSAVRALRNCQSIKRLVYVSCNPKTMIDNVVRLSLPCGTSKKTNGAPFRPIVVIPVDMFPHTAHCEAIMLLERDYKE